MKQGNVITVHEYLDIVDLMWEHPSILPYIRNISERILLLLFWFSKCKLNNNV